MFLGFIYKTLQLQFKLDNGNEYGVPLLSSFMPLHWDNAYSLKVIPNNGLMFHCFRQDRLSRFFTYGQDPLF